MKFIFKAAAPAATNSNSNGGSDIAAPILLYSDEFTETIAAPIPAGNADVRGYRVVNDAESLMTIGSGVLNIPAQASAVWGDEYYRAQPSSGQQYWERPTGKALVALVDFRHSTRAEQMLGWWTAAALDSNTPRAIYTPAQTIRTAASTAVSDAQAYSAAADYQAVAVWDSTGFHTYIKISGIWHKKWFRQEVLTQAYCGMSNFNAVGSLKYFRVYAIDESLFAPALSIANPSVGNLANMPDGDFLLYLANITRPSGGDLLLRFRKQNSNSYWRKRVSSTGAAQISEFVAGVGTIRINSSGVVSTDNLVTIARAQSIQAWRNTTALGSVYTSAYNFLREIGLELNSLGTGGAIANLYVWKARLLDESGLGSELVVNGDFGTDTVWTKGTGWTISGGTANKVAGSSANLQQAGILTVGTYYELTFTVSNYSAGTVSPFVGTGATLAPISANGTYTVKTVCAGTADLGFAADATFVGSIDNVSCKEIQFADDNLATVLNGVLTA